MNAPLVLPALALAVTGCATASLAPPATGAPNTGALPGPAWHLTEIRSPSGAATAPEGEGRFTVSFLGDGRFVGRADCNRYGGTFEATSNGDLVLTNTSTTVAACAPPSSSHAFFGVVNQVVGFGVSGGRLTLRGADESALVFERAAGWQEPQETGRDLAYTCDGPGGRFTFRARTGPGELAVWLPRRFEGREGGAYLVLGQAVSASGARYEDGPVTVWTHGGEALLVVDGAEYRGCAAQH